MLLKAHVVRVLLQGCRRVLFEAHVEYDASPALLPLHYPLARLVLNRRGSVAISCRPRAVFLRTFVRECNGHLQFVITNVSSTIGSHSLHKQHDRPYYWSARSLRATRPSFTLAVHPPLVRARLTVEVRGYGRAELVRLGAHAHERHPHDRQAERRRDHDLRGVVRLEVLCEGWQVGVSPRA